MEKKKSKVGLIIILFVLVLLVGLSIPTKTALKDGGTVIYKAPLWSYTKYHSMYHDGYYVGDQVKILGIKVIDNTKIEKYSKKATKVSETKKADSKVVEIDDSSFRIYSGENLTENKDFGKVKFGDSEVNIKFDKGDGAIQKLYVGDKSIELVNGGLSNIAIMGNYLVLGIEGSGYRFEVYNQSLQEVEKVGNSSGLLLNTTPDYTKWIIDEHNLIYYNCSNDTLETYNLQIDGSNIIKILLTSTSSIACTAQR